MFTHATDKKGIHMVIISSDIYYYSSLFRCTGTISTVSSEMSVLTLCFITADRLYNIMCPLSSKKLRLKSARVIISFLWAFVIVLAAVPNVPNSYFQSRFYSRSGVCVSIYITNEQTPGWEYSVALYHGMNLSVFIFIFLAYGYMYTVIKGMGMVMKSDQKKREMAAARKMTLIVLTDFCCWIPINIMGKIFHFLNSSYLKISINIILE